MNAIDDARKARASDDELGALDAALVAWRQTRSVLVKHPVMRLEHLGGPETFYELLAWPTTFGAAWRMLPRYRHCHARERLGHGARERLR